jgi:hypothetical protein
VRVGATEFTAFAAMKIGAKDPLALMVFTFFGAPYRDER